MSVLSTKEIVEALSERVSMDPEQTKRGMDAAVEMFRGKLKQGIGIRLDSFAEIQIYEADGGMNGNSLLIPSKEAAGALAGPLDISPEQADGFLRELVALVGEFILRGHRVEIDRFVSLNITEEKARVAKNEGGSRVITPARKVLSFSLDPELKSDVGESKKFAFMPDPAFRERISGLRASTILLVLPEEDFFTKTIRFHFEKAGWSVKTATSASEAMKVVESGETYQLILDDPIPDSQKLIERIKCHLDTARVPVITMLPSGADPKTTSSFRISPDQFVIQPFEVKALLDRAENELARGAEEDAIFRQEVHFRFATGEEFINRANELGGELFERSGLDNEAQVALCVAFREAIGNSAQHGNRYRRDKTIEVMYLLDNEKITVNVTDQGGGFDHRFYTNRGAGGNALAAARERHQQGRLGGLGIMLMMKCTDRIEYNETGNSVTLTKFLGKDGS